MTKLPPLANLLTIRDENPQSLAALTASLKAHSDFDTVFHPAPHWVCAQKYLPDSQPDPPEARATGLVFCEGRDEIESGHQRNTSARFQSLAAKLQAAPHSLHEFPGDFGFLHFSAQGDVSAVRSCGGLVPIYWWTQGQRIALATRLDLLIRYAGVPAEPDALTAAIWAIGWPGFPDGRAPLAGVRVLERGHSVRLSPHRPPALTQYWQPRPDSVPAPTPRIEQEHHHQLRTILLEHLSRHLHPDGGNLLTLSGGVDSSSLAALATKVLGRTISTWSLIPSNPATLAREQSYLQPLLQSLGITQSWFQPLHKNAIAELMSAWSVPCAFPVLHPALLSLPKLCAGANIHTLFGGEFADEVCGSVKTYPDLSDSLSLADLVRNRHRLPDSAKSLPRWVKHRALRLLGMPLHPMPPRLPPPIRKEIRAEYREWRVGLSRNSSRDPKPNNYLAVSAKEMDGFVVMNWEACTLHSVRRIFPFFSRRVLELAFQCHPWERVGPDTKRLLRGALAADVPSSNLLRPDKGNFEQTPGLLPAINTENSQWLHKIMEGSDLQSSVTDANPITAWRLYRLTFWEASTKAVQVRYDSPVNRAA